MGKLVRNTMFVASGQTFTKIISFFSIPIIARMLGTDGFGAYTLAFSFVMLFSEPHRTMTPSDVAIETSSLYLQTYKERGYDIYLHSAHHDNLPVGKLKV